MKRTAVVCVGNRMRGDDAVGPLVADRLRDVDGLTVFDAGMSPENYLDPVVKLEPELLVLVDACAFGGEPGEFRVFEREDVERLAGGMVSTHTLPLSMTVALLEQQVDAEIRFIGVQPGHLEFDAGVSEPVEKAVPLVVRRVVELAGAVSA